MLYFIMLLFWESVSVAVNHCAVLVGKQETG